MGDRNVVIALAWWSMFFYIAVLGFVDQMMPVSDALIFTFLCSLIICASIFHAYYWENRNEDQFMMFIRIIGTVLILVIAQSLFTIYELVVAAMLMYPLLIIGAIIILDAVNQYNKVSNARG